MSNATRKTHTGSVFVVGSSYWGGLVAWLVGFAQLHTFSIIQVAVAFLRGATQQT